MAVPINNLLYNPCTYIKDDKSKFIANKVYSSTAKRMIHKEVYRIIIFSFHLCKLFPVYHKSLYI